MQSATPKPTFYIVGAPKCGTTSLSQYLKQHPDVFIPWYKEPHFFGSDLQARKYIRDEARYLALFRDGGGHRQLGEASTWYLYSRRAAREIKAYTPSARIIVMLRNPTELAYSLHSHNLYVGNEDIREFDRALDAEVDRKRGLSIPHGATHPDTLYYSEIGKFADQLSRYLDVFGPERVHVILFDDFQVDTPKVYRETLRFLNVDENFAADFRVENANKRVRSGALRAFIRHSTVQNVGRTLLPARMAERIASGLRSLNTQYEQRPQLDQAVRARLHEEYDPDVRRLSVILGRDLSAWISS